MKNRYLYYVLTNEDDFDIEFLHTVLSASQLKTAEDFYRLVTFRATKELHTYKRLMKKTGATEDGLEKFWSIENERAKKLLRKKFGTVNIEKIDFQRRKLRNGANRLFLSGYSMGEETWFAIKQDKGTILKINNTKRYKGRYKGWERWGFAKIVFKSYAEFFGLEIIENILTYRKPNGRAVWWVNTEEKRHWKIERVAGWCIGTSHAQTKAEALRLEVLKAKKRTLKSAPLNRIWVTIDGLKKAGACGHGIYSGVRQLGIETKKIGAVRADLIVEKLGDFGERWARRGGIVV